MVLGFFVSLEDRQEEVALREEERVRPHRHRLNGLLERFGLPNGVLCGVVFHCLGFGGFLALPLVEAPRTFFLSFARLGEGLHGLVGSVALYFRQRVF